MASTQGGTSLLWFRDDLRLADHPALRAAASSGPVIAFVILDETSLGLRPLGGAARWFLHHALESLARDLKAIGGRLDLFTGAARDIVPRLAEAASARALFCSRRYQKTEQAVDAEVATALQALGVEVKTFNGHLLFEPGDVTAKNGGTFKVFSAYWRAARARRGPDAPLPAPGSVAAAPYPAKAPHRSTLDALAFLPMKPDWAGGLRETWKPSESAGAAALQDFVATRIDGYGWRRNRPDVSTSSQLSPFLRHGLLSARQVFHAAEAAHGVHRVSRADIDKFQAELAWRDFDYGLMHVFPDLATRNYQPAFDRLPWAPPKAAVLRAWQRGMTGYPIVDAGMRQLWHTGYMHNRLRMITASFLIKDLLIDWRRGEEWFWDTLCDADPANNSVNWQWVAGSGPDSSPFFRVFNPVLQGEKHDPTGAYVKTFVPELARLDAAWVHKPWEAPAGVLEQAGIVLGKTYPPPIVDHEEARDRALAAYAAMRESAG